MAMIRPSAPQYKPEDDLQVAGQFMARCVAIRTGLPNKSFPNGKPNMAIEFVIDDDNYRKLKGKKTAIICTESVFRDPETRRESHLLAHARMMGHPEPEKGVDPETFIGKWYMIRVEQVDGRCYVRTAMLMPTPTGRGVQPGVTLPAAAGPDADGPDGETVPF